MCLCFVILCACMQTICTRILTQTYDETCKHIYGSTFIYKHTCVGVQTSFYFYVFILLILIISSQLSFSISNHHLDYRCSSVIGVFCPSLFQVFGILFPIPVICFNQCLLLFFVRKSLAFLYLFISIFFSFAYLFSRQNFPLIH